MGALQYASLARSLSICMPPQKIHMIAAYKRTLQFLKYARMYGLLFKSSPFSVQASCDADWAGSPSDPRLRVAFVSFWGPTQSLCVPGSNPH